MNDWLLRERFVRKYVSVTWSRIDSAEKGESCDCCSKNAVSILKSSQGGIFYGCAEHAKEKVWSCK